MDSSRYLVCTDKPTGLVHLGHHQPRCGTFAMEWKEPTHEQMLRLYENVCNTCVLASDRECEVYECKNEAPDVVVYECLHWDFLCNGHLHHLMTEVNDDSLSNNR